VSDKLCAYVLIKSANKLRPNDRIASNSVGDHLVEASEDVP
jgi:hypothetical protein